MEYKKINLIHIIDRFTEMLVDYSPRVFMAIITLFVGFWVANRISKIFHKALISRNLDPTIVPFFASFTSVLIKVLVIVSVATKFGIETTSFVAMIGGAGLAIGLALQGSLSHFASGILILIFKPYRVGDTITAGGQTGKVLEILILQTILQSSDNHKIIIPNGTIMSSTIINQTGLASVKVHLTFTLSGDSNIEQVKTLIKNEVAKCPFIEKNHDVSISVNTSDLNAMKLDIKMICDAENTGEAKDYLYEALKIAFDKNGVFGPEVKWSHLENIVSK